VRACVTHQRLLLAGEPTTTLWTEASAGLKHALLGFAGGSEPKLHGGQVVSTRATEAWLELGLAQFHFNKGDLGKGAFGAARQSAALKVEMTGAMGKRTKFQTKSVAQMVLKASTTAHLTAAELALLPCEEGEDEAPPKPFIAATLTGKWEKEAAEKKAAAEKAIVLEAVAVAADYAPAPPVPAAAPTPPEAPVDPSLPRVEVQAEDSILLERTKFDDHLEVAEEKLGRHHLSVLLALCLDVKNSNPKDGLTTEEMQPYVARVLLHHQDWTIYSTALLQRAWLDFESHYAKDRATLQIQALVDQHGATLTFTQLSYDAIASSAPPQHRVRALHAVVYPPRWELKKDLAQRYAALGILVSAAQLFEELELWDDVVDCNSRMGRKAQALQLVRARLAVLPTPRMLCALGDLTDAPESTAHYAAAWALSGGRFAKAQRLLGREAVNLAQACAHREAAERRNASDTTNRALVADAAHADRLRDEGVAHLLRAEAALGEALALQPSVTADWFLLGTVRMRLEKWQAALTAFSTVVAHAPDSGDAWGNVGAIHLRLKRPDLAVAAFTEGLKASRESWRMWENKLLACLQMRPLPPAADAAYCATQLLDLHARGVGRGVDTALLAAVASAALKAEGLSADVAHPSALAPPLLDEALDGAAFALRPVPRQVGTLLERVTASTSMAVADPKVWEVLAIFDLGLGRRQRARNGRLKHVRALMLVPGWDKKAADLAALADAIAELVHLHALPTANTAAAAAAAAETPAALVPASEAAPELQQLHGVELLVRGVLKKAEAFGAAGASGDNARETLRGALATVKELLTAQA
jgi:tetratricopeptide (TPR) repeat protein